MGRKSTTIALSNEDRDYLELQTRARTIQAQTVNRARILLLKAEGTSIDDIADKVGMNRKSVMLCINKYLAGGIDNALFDAPGRGRNAEITDDEKAWIISIACQRPVDLGYAAETWTRALLTKHINKVAESAGHIRPGKRAGGGRTADRESRDGCRQKAENARRLPSGSLQGWRGGWICRSRFRNPKFMSSLMMKSQEYRLLLLPRMI